MGICYTDCRELLERVVYVPLVSEPVHGGGNGAGGPAARGGLQALAQLSSLHLLLSGQSQCSLSFFFIAYYVSNNSLPILYSKLLYKMGNYFLDI